MRLIAVKPQPKGIERPWPNRDSHIEWIDVIEDPNYYYACYVEETRYDVSVTQGIDDVWYWQVEDQPNEPK